MKRDEDTLGRLQRRTLRRVNAWDSMIAKHPRPNRNQVVQKARVSRRESEVRECLRLRGSLETLNLVMEGEFNYYVLKWPRKKAENPVTFSFRRGKIGGMAGLVQNWWEGAWSAFQVAIVHAVRSIVGVTAKRMPQMQCELPVQGIQSDFDVNDWTIKRKNMGF